jgi:prophage regulatory protein
MNDFLRLPKVADVMCMSRSTVYLRVKEGLMTPPVKLSTRCSVWPENEITAIKTARIAQKSEDEIRQLVILLKQQRRSLMA